MAKKKNQKWMIIVASVGLAIIAAGICIFRFKNYVGIRGKQLNTYSCSCGGGMTGGYHRETVKRFGQQALITIESAEWHLQDPTVTEYLTDASVLDELASVVRENRMNFWNKKKFTNVFVADGESKSYSFDFDDADISFSSQIYPTRYGKKLAKLDDVVKKYIEAGKKLPGLVNLKSK